MKELFLIFEPANHVYKVIEAAHRAGYEVVAFHSSPLTPPAPYDSGLKFIDRTVPMDDWNNREAALEVVRRTVGSRKVGGTYSGPEVALRMEAQARREYGLPGNAPEVVSAVLDKGAVRARLREQGLSALRQVDERQLRALVEWPFPGKAGFVKPVNGAGSTYVSRCRTVAELQGALADWDAASRRVPAFVQAYLKRGGVFMEEEAVGDLMSLEGFAWQGKYQAVGLLSRDVLQRDIAVEMGATFPYQSPRYQEIVDFVTRVHQALGVEHGPTHTEIIVPRDGGPIELVELNLRFAGGDVLILVNEAFGQPFEDVLVQLAIGRAPAFPALPEPARYASLQYLLAPSGTPVLDKVEVTEPGVVFFKQMKPDGTTLSTTDFQGDHVAGFVVSAETYDGALGLAQRVRMNTKVNGRALGENTNNTISSY